MSDRGIHGILTDGIKRKDPCLVIGDLVPRRHHSDGIPVYVIVEHASGIPIVGKDKRLRNLLAYPSHYPGPGEHMPDEWLFASHEQLPWEALIPCFTGQRGKIFAVAPVSPENMTDVCDRLNLPLPPKL